MGDAAGANPGDDEVRGTGAQAMVDDPTTVMQRFFESFQAGDIPAVAALFHPEARIRESSELPFGGEYRGPDGFTKLLAAMSRDYELEVTGSEVLPSGDRVVTRMATRFTSRTSGAVAEVSVAEIYTIRDGLIQDLDVYYQDPGAVATLNERAR
jgi:hypothetical protein